MPAAHYYGLILAGGRGTRFWPRSRKARAKQVLKFFGERSLIQQTVDRLQPVLPPQHIWVLTNHLLRAEIIRQLPEVPRNQILAEPVQRNTAPAMGLAAHILESLDPEAVMGVFPADHVITNTKAYRRLLRPAFKAAERGRLVVMGIQPRWPETGYGYIELPPGVTPGSVEPVPVRRFREKPDLKTAKKFLSAGRFFWNAGMFFMRARVLLDELRLHQPVTAAILDSLPGFGSRGFAKAVARRFPECENISIDFGVMERSRIVSGIAAGDIGWNDVGSWNAVHALHAQDQQHNVIHGEVILHNATGNYVDGGGKLVALVGVRDLVVVETPDALLVASRERSQEVGEIVKRLEQRRREDLL
ncbi:MAG: mannose-1-phosphate guanylyltransferase [Bryobacterales bacterium]|nr:mannose-1-phosphate guanylyltransferase [Bryobacterales bacterium]